MRTRQVGRRADEATRRADTEKPASPAAPERSGGGSGPTRGSKPAPLSPWELTRWAWRQLTSMRTALLLLFLLALAAIPGSLVPQRGVNPVEVAAFAEQNPGLALWYDRLGLFDVYASPWFAAVYLALMVSLLGCIVPRVAQHWTAMRAQPPATPRHLHRLPAYRTWTTEADPATVLAAARTTLRGRRFRLRREPVEGSVDAEESVAAERGHLRETGNLAFHVAVVVVLVGVAVGQLFGFTGTAVVVAGNGFANTVTQYDAYQAGRFFDESQLPPFALTLRDFQVEFATEPGEQGSPRRFDAYVDYTVEPGAAQRSYHLRVNHPLRIDGAQVHLLNHGYAPRFTVRDGHGDVAFSGPVPFLPQDATFTSTGVVKVPDAVPDQLGFQGFFLPTAAVDEQRGPYSAFPDALAPSVFLTAFHGDLGLDDGVPQSVYELDTEGLTQFEQDGGEPFRVALTPGQSADLPDGRGTIRFDGYERWANLQISRDPGELVALGGAVLAVVGVLGSLFVQRRRAWVRVRSARGRTVIEVAGLDRAHGGAASAEVEAIAEQLRRHAPPREEETTR